MAVEFPSSPNITDRVYGPNGAVWAWDGQKWVANAARFQEYDTRSIDYVTMGGAETLITYTLPGGGNWEVNGFMSWQNGSSFMGVEMIVLALSLDEGGYDVGKVVGTTFIPSFYFFGYDVFWLNTGPAVFPGGSIIYLVVDLPVGSFGYASAKLTARRVG
jgi:hypothetical protein